jgi:uncharacterized membrane protein
MSTLDRWPVALVGMLLALIPAPALAHTSGEGATVAHVLTEMGVWGIGVVATIGLVTAVFWVRANWIRRNRS